MQDVPFTERTEAITLAATGIVVIMYFYRRSVIVNLAYVGSTLDISLWELGSYVGGDSLHRTHTYCVPSDPGAI